MKQKRVSFKVAKAIKEAGYPQYGSCEEFYFSDGHVVDKMCDMHKLIYPCPTYLDVWLWLWREKKLEIEVFNDGVGLTSQIRMQGRPQFFNNDPEEVIIAAIDYLANNDLIK